jgi:endonuclease G
MINYYSNANNMKHGTYQLSHPIIGGWAPVFFNDYDPEKIEQINQQIFDNKIKNIKIHYSENMHKLAFRIKNNLHCKKIKIDMNFLDLKDTGNTNYNHNQVIVTLYFK